MRSEPARRLDALAHDQLLPWLAGPPSDRVVVVEIDERSLEAYGRWPWPRQLHATLIDRLAATGVRVIGYDVLFAEPAPHDPAGDAALEAAVARARNVVLPVAAEPPRAGEPPVEILPFGRLPLSAAALGHAHLRPDPDGRLRRLHLAAGVGDPFWPALALAVQRQALAGDAAPSVAPAAGQWSAWGLGWIEESAVLVPIAADPARLRRYSAADLLAREATPELADAIVLVGVTAQGLAPPVAIGASAHHAAAPAVHFQALAVEALIQGTTIAVVRRPDLAAGVLAAAAFLPWLAAGWRRRRLAGSALALVPLLPLAVGLGTLLTTRATLPFASVSLMVAALVAAAGLWRLLDHLRRAQLARGLAHAALTHVADAVLTTDATGVVDYANPAAERLLGRTVADLVGQPLEHLAPPIAELASGATTHPPSAAPRADAASRGGGSARALPLVTLDGRRRTVRADIRRLGEPPRAGFVVAMSDITEEQRLLDEVAFRASHDSLTGLPNRHLLIDRLAGAIGRARRQGGLVGVAFLDVDRLKSINDALGHAVGDAVLIDLAGRFRRLGRSTDTVGRLGGDEFVLVLEGLRTRDEVAAAIARYRQSFDRPVAVDGRPLQVKASIGIAVFPDDGDGPDTLLRRADAAMYRAKKDGRDQVVTYDAALHGEAGDGLLLDAALREAIDSDQLELHYQPRIDLVDRRPAGLESLVRWRHPEQGLLPPGRFIGLAEETGSIVELGRWVLARACADLAGPALRRSGLRLSINVSVVQLKRDPGLVDFVRATLAEHGLAPGRLELEVTESLFLDPSLPTLGRRLASLAELGVHLSIDDFGTGYSSLAYINRFPFDRIKIDRSFVHAVHADKGAQAIVRAIVGLSAALAKKTTAEGVEQPGQLAFLDQLECNEAQGYLFGRPAPLPEMLAALAR